MSEKIIVCQGRVPPGESFEIEMIDLSVNDLLEEARSLGTVRPDAAAKPPGG